MLRYLQEHCILCWLGVYVGSSVLSKESSICCRGLTVRRPTGSTGDTLCRLDNRYVHYVCVLGLGGVLSR